jgi:sporulation protein YlmC with PRC-barrel domain
MAGRGNASLDDDETVAFDARLAAMKEGSAMGQWPENRLSVLMQMNDLEGKREFSFPDIRGWKVLNTTGHEVGKVEEVFVDPNTREPGMVLLHYQKPLNPNTKKLLVPWHELRLGDRFAQTRWSEEELLPETARQVPAAQPATAVAESVEVTLRPHPPAEPITSRAGPR